MPSQIYLLILNETAQHEVNGISTLSKIVNCHNKSWLLNLLRRAQSIGEITIIDNGISKPKTIRRINRNSPGYRRRIHVDR